MVLVLLLIAVASVIIAGWISVISARSNMVEQMTAASQRRIAYENSRALSQEFMLERVLPSTSGAAFSYSLSGSWGGISVPAWGSAPLLSVQKAAGYNHFNPGNGDGYTLDLSLTLFNGDNNPSRKFQIKSRSPAFAGELLTAQVPTLSPGSTLAIGALAAGGPAFIWSPNLSMNFTASSYTAPEGSATVTFHNSSGSTLLMNNLALPRQIANPRSWGLAYFGGQFDAINNTNLAANSSYNKAMTGSVTTVSGTSVSSTNGVTCDGAGNVTIVLNTMSLGNVYIHDEVSSLTLTGQSSPSDAAADDLPAILILVDQLPTSSRDLTSVTLSQHNSRRLDLAIKKESSAGNLPITFSTSSATWRMLLECENTPVAFTAPGVVTLKGGIRSDRTLALSSGSLQISRESDPKYLERLATRTAWVESFAP